MTAKITSVALLTALVAAPAKFAQISRPAPELTFKDQAGQTTRLSSCWGSVPIVVLIESSAAGSSSNVFVAQRSPPSWTAFYPAALQLSKRCYLI